MNNHTVIVITGPTASGKTPLGVSLALALKSEVVSADSMQLYRGLDIGSAKPTGKEMRGGPHRMIDVADPWEDYSVSRWVESAAACCDALLAQGMPAAVISIEAPGANDVGVYHNAGGLDVSALEAKSVVLWEKLRALGVPSVAIGDLGNEIGMGKIADHIRSFVPFTAHGECSCGCKGGILAASTADSIITATCSDWGCYGLMAALAYLLRNIDILHTEEMEAEVMRTAARSGMIDMTGSLLPGIDGFNLKMNVSILSLMRQCTDYALRYSHNSDRWFGPVLAKHFFE